jgi:EmrB/QacA subfamily drug resistance transporter
VSAPPLATGVSRAAPDGKKARTTLLVAVIGSRIAFLDGTVVNVALPVMQRELGVTVDGAQWVVEAYALLLASLVLVGGALGDRYGRKLVFLAGVIAFSLSSAACGAAPSALLLIVARAVQGIGAALLVPGSLALISAAYPDDEARGRAIGTWSSFSAITAAIGPVAGGWVVTHASWRWLFYFNVPIAALVLVLAIRGVDETRDDAAPRSMDWAGAVLVTVGLGLVVYGLIDSGKVAGATGEIALVIGGVLTLVAFVYVESRLTAPMVPLALFRSRTFAGVNLLTLLLYGALGGALFLVPFDLIQVQGYSPTAAGASLLPLVVLVSVMSPAAGVLSARIGPRYLLAIGPVVAATGFFLLALPGVGGSYWTTFFPGVVVLGLGMGIAVAPLTTAVMSSVDRSHSGVASGVNNAVSRAGGLLAIAVLGVVLHRRFDSVLDAALAPLQLPAANGADVAAEPAHLGAAQLDDVEGPLRDALRDAFARAFVAGFRTVMIASATLAALGGVAGLVMVRNSERARVSS